MKITLHERLTESLSRINDMQSKLSAVMGSSNPIVLALEHESIVLIHILGCVKDNTYTSPDPRN